MYSKAIPMLGSVNTALRAGVAATLLSSFLALAVFAQNPPKKESPSGFAKFKPPKVGAYLGAFSGTNAICDVDQGRQLIRMPLRVEDDKKNSYKVTSYQFGYTRIGVVEDEESGKISPQSDMVSGQFNATPLPELWQSTIAETLRKGEQFYFFDIICSDKQGRMFFAPELKITMK
jgi:hypothetical protein